MNNFDFIAPYYDLLAKVVFGKSLLASQRVHIPLIPQRARMLILGGGTGQSAWEIAQSRPDAEIVFVEKSDKMINLARQRFPSEIRQNISFINIPYQEYQPTSGFDVIVAQCFFDVFAKNQLLHATRFAFQWLNEEGQLLVTDFQAGDGSGAKFWQRSVLQSMQLFFRFYANIEGTQLEDINATLIETGFQPSHQELFYGDLIFSRTYVKDPAAILTTS